MLLGFFATGEPRELVDKAQGNTAKEIGKDAFKLFQASLSAATSDPGPESPANDQQPQNGSDPTDPAEPLVTVEQPEESKRHPYSEGNFFYRTPKPYHLTLKDPSNDDGWVALYTQIGIDGPTYYGGWRRVLKQAMAVLAVQLSGEELEEPTEETCLGELLGLLRQWRIKLKGNPHALKRLRQRMRKLASPDLWKGLDKECELIEAGPERGEPTAKT
jgi:hypothetical protein